ncbi:MAG TPA: hypothetical protein VFW86_00705 [Candidatus Limnocylindrales bacterium]|nr:hypothetical protein [Candidatus Limnocylindrales bacterium]
MDAPRTIVAVTGEDDRYRGILATAEQRALDEHATLILYDLDAGRDPLESPLPTEWSGDTETTDVTDRMGPEELEAAGRQAIADQVRAARQKGIDAWGWLPDDDGRDTLVEYAEQQVDPLVLVPEDETDLREAMDVESVVVPMKR